MDRIARSWIARWRNRTAPEAGAGRRPAAFGRFAAGPSRGRPGALVPLLVLGANLPLAVAVVLLARGGEAASALGLAASAAGVTSLLLLVTLLRRGTAAFRRPADGTAPDAAAGMWRGRGRRARELDARLKALETLARTDHLTGAYNRQAGEQRLREHLAGGRRRPDLRPAVALLDLDRFKELNDAHGHAFGDAALRHLVGVVRDSLRADDWIARWGGDEFVIGLAGGSEASYARALRRVIAALRESPLTTPSGEVRCLSVSIGLAVAASPEDEAAPLARADAALYRAKAEGRGRLLLAPPAADAA